jgi:gluconolactonase
MLLETPQLTRIVDTDAHEGPVYLPAENALYFTTSRPEVAIRRLALDSDPTISMVRPTANANGMALGRDGRLIVCEQGSLDRAAAITAVDPATGETETIVDSWGGRPLNSPNDVVVGPDGGIWFTDPSYGYLQGFRPRPALPDQVYRYDPALQTLQVVAAGLDKPNGLAFSPDGLTLYVADNGAPHHLLAFDVVGRARLAGQRVIAVLGPEHPDGVKVDRDGRIYASTPTGIAVLAPTGEQFGELELPGAVNFTFAGDVLYITADSAIWAATVSAHGGPPGP